MRISDWSSDVCSSDLRRSPESLTAYDHYLLANEGRTLFTGESISRGLAAATKAITLEPTLGRAYVARAWLNYITVHCGGDFEQAMQGMKSEEHTSELQSLMRISYAVFCLKKKKKHTAKVRSTQ